MTLLSIQKVQLKAWTLLKPRPRLRLYEGNVIPVTLKRRSENRTLFIPACRVSRECHSAPSSATNANNHVGYVGQGGALYIDETTHQKCSFQSETGKMHDRVKKSGRPHVDNTYRLILAVPGIHQTASAACTLNTQRLSCRRKSLTINNQSSPEGYSDAHAFATEYSGVRVVLTTILFRTDYWGSGPQWNNPALYAAMWVGLALKSPLETSTDETIQWPSISERRQMNSETAK